MIATFKSFFVTIYRFKIVCVIHSLFDKIELVFLTYKAEATVKSIQELFITSLNFCIDLDYILQFL